jgi:hypothetical protein
MKKALILATFVLACGAREEPATDTAAMAIGPAALTANELAGTWSGVAMADTGSAVLGRFTVISPTGMDSKTVTEGQTDTVNVTHTIDGDSVVATSAPHVDPTLPGKPTVTFRAVGRLVGGKLVGTSVTMLASKPDSILSRARIEMTKNP